MAEKEATKSSCTPSAHVHGANAQNNFSKIIMSSSSMLTSTYATMRNKRKSREKSVGVEEN